MPRKLLPASLMTNYIQRTALDSIESIRSGGGRAARTLRKSQLRRRLWVETLEDRRLLVGEIEPNDTFATGTPFNGTDTLTGQIANQLDVDHFTIAANAGERLQFRAATNSESMPSFDAAMELVNQAGDVLASAMDAHSISFQVAVQGTYALRLSSRSVFGPYVGSYNIQATVTAFAGVTEQESNNTPATANALGGQTSLRGSLASATDVDTFSLSLQAGQAVAVNFSEFPARNPAVRLLNAAGTTIASGLNGLGLATTVSAAGDYFVSVAADNSLGTVTGGYVAQALVSTNPAVDTEAGDDFYAATVIDLGPHVVPSQYLSTGAAFLSQGLTGSYINQSLRGTAAQTDWRTAQTVAGTRIDPTLHFSQSGWGTRSTVGITGGNDNDWDNFSVQWDGYFRIVNAGTQLFISSDDSSRLWIDLNGDGSFDTTGDEFVNNNWGAGQGNTLSQPSVPLAAGDYRIRIQYEEGNGGNVAYLLWNDSQNSAGQSVSLNQTSAGIGVLDSLADVDIFAVDLSGTGFYEFRLETTAGGMGSQSRLMTLYNEYGQPLDYSHHGFLNTTGWNTRVERTSRYYIAVQATSPTGLGSYELVPRVAGEFPRYRDVPLFFQDYSQYTKPAHIPLFMAMFEARFDPYQVDLTQTRPVGTEFVGWQFDDEAGSGCGGAQGGSFGNRRPSGNGSGSCDANWTRLSDVWFGLFYHENGHGVGLFHSRHPLNTMSYGGQYDFLPIGSFNWMGLNGNGDPLVSSTRLFNMRDYLDWALESGRIVLESESNNTTTTAQFITPYIEEMAADAEARNDQAIVVGSVGAISDVDYYRLTAAAGQMFSLDVDSAEFQTALDATLEIIDADGNVLAVSEGGIDRNTGLSSADPNLNHRFSAAGDYFIRISGEALTTGYYRLKISPEHTLDTDGPKIVGAWPDGGQTIDSTRQLTWWVNDQLDPATLTAANVVVRGANTGVHTGTPTFDPFTSIMTWYADAPLPVDNYTVTLRGSAGGITDLQGNLLDGETDGVLGFPEISGNGSRGGDFVTTFVVNGSDSTAATAFALNYFRQNHERDLLDIFFSDEMDVQQVNQAAYTLRGAGADRAFGTSDDTFAPVDVMYDPMTNMTNRLLRVYTRGMLPPDNYRVEATLRDASGFTVDLSRTFQVAAAVPATALSTTTAGTTRGLVGSYVNTSLRAYNVQDDWRTSQQIAGTRVDQAVNFTTDSFGTRNDVNITGGTDQNWDNFSVQWDGFITIPANGVRLFTRSDDGSRMWIDINNDGTFDASGAEFINNGWGNGQGVTTGPASAPLNAGTYRVRMQYEEGGGGNRMSLLWDFPDANNTNDGMFNNLKIVDVNLQPNTVVTQAPASFDVTFSELVAPASLTANSFRLIYSPDADFFDDNDQIVPAANGQIGWDPLNRRASFTPGTNLTGGYYMLELNGDPGGITSLGGRLLDGEYRDGYIVGGPSQQAWSDTPSGDGIPGGDYRAIFILSQPSVALQVRGNASIAEGGGVATIEARLSFASQDPITVELAFSGDATPGVDYTTGSTLLTIPAGSLVATTTVNARQDTIDEDDELVNIRVAAVTNATISQNASTTVTIVDDENAPLVLLSTNGTTLNEAAGTRTITATLAALSERDVEVVLSFGGQAIQNVDYTTSATTISIPAGQLSGSIHVTAMQDSIDEVDESLTIAIASALNATSNGSQVSLTIIDDDVPPTFSLSINTPNMAEAGGIATIIATLSTASSFQVTIPLTYSGTASSNDYSGTVGQLLIAPGATTAQFSLTATQDFIDEPDESIVVQAGTAVNATAGTPISVTAIIRDDDLPPPTFSLSISALTLAEAGGTTTVTATLSAVSPLPVTIPLTYAGTASSNDYSGAVSELFIAPGERTAQVVLSAVQDFVDEVNETIIVRAGTPVNATAGFPTSVTATIQDDDLPPTLTLISSTNSISENGGVGLITARLSSISSLPVTVRFALGDGTATLDEDYNTSPNVLVIEPGNTDALLGITGLNDSIYERDEVLIVGIEELTNATQSAPQSLQVVITNDDLPPVASLSISQTAISEDIGEIEVVATLDQVSAVPALITLAATGTAALGADYLIDGLQLEIPAGSLTASKTITIVQDQIDEPNETIQLSIASSLDVNTGGVTLPVIIVEDDDLPPEIDLSFDHPSIAEGVGNGNTILRARLSSISTFPITAQLQWSGTATVGSDYNNMPLSVTIPAGSQEAALSLVALPDAVYESDETILVDILSAQNARVAADSGAELTITDDDRPPVLTMTLDRTSIFESAATVLVTLRLSAAAGVAASVGFAFGGTATLGQDFSVSTQVTIPAFTTRLDVPMTILQDAVDEINETVIVQISDLVNATTSSNSATLTIIDDESFAMTIDRASVSEVGGRAMGTLRRVSSDLSQAVVVTLQSLDTSEIVVPETVTIQPFEATATFPITAVDDTLFDGTQTVSIVASGQGLLDATGSIQVTDLESLSLTINADSVDERGPAVTATVTRGNTDIDDAVVISLIGTWAGLLDLPDELTIPAGQASLQFELPPIDNFLLTGPQTVSLRVEADGYSPGIDQIQILDDELERPYRNPRNRLDVNNDTFITPLDILRIVNHINRLGAGSLPPIEELPFEPSYYPDTSGDNLVSPLDILLIVNHLNANNESEGESARAVSPVDMFFADLDLLSVENDRKLGYRIFRT